MTKCISEGCENEVISTPGRRPKLYCSPSCRQKEWLKKNSAKPKTNTSNIVYRQHDLTCSAHPDKRMGCEGCSCEMYKRAKRAEKEVEDLKKQLQDAQELHDNPSGGWDKLKHRKGKQGQNKPDTAPETENVGEYIKRMQEEADKPEKVSYSSKEHFNDIANGRDIEQMPEGLTPIQQAVWRNNQKMKNKTAPKTIFGSSKKDKE